MKVLELMERAGSRDTNLCIAWIKDAIHTIESAQNKPLNLRAKKSLTLVLKLKKIGW